MNFVTATLVRSLFGWFLFGLIFLTGAPAADWKQEEGFKWRMLPKPNQQPAVKLFTELPTVETGVRFTNVISELALARNRILGNGSGVAVGDLNGDGLPEIFLAGLESPGRLFLNRGNWQFSDATAALGLPLDLNPCVGAVMADVNGDGWLDLLLGTPSQGIRIFHNQEGKRFIEHKSGTENNRGATTMALADIDGNGTLDLYVSNYRTNDIRDRGRVMLKSVGGKMVIPPEYKDRLLMRGTQVIEFGQPDQLFLNDGKGTFSSVSWTNGTFLDFQGNSVPTPPLDWGLSAAFRDVNGDGAPDLYVCNDYWTPDRLWLNDGLGHFRLAPPLLLRKIPSSSMGVDFADIDRDGDLDFFVVEMLSSDAKLRKRQMIADFPMPPGIGINPDLPQVFHNTLYLNRGDNTFAEAAHFAGLEATDWSWSPVFLDADLDGFEDLFITAGHFRDVQDLDAQRIIQQRQHSWENYTNEVVRQETFTRELLENYRVYPELKFPVRAYKNLGGAKFAEATVEWGFQTSQVHHGLALGDLDGDGDLDLIVNALNGPAGLYRNNASQGRVAVRLAGNAPNNQGIGAKLSLKADGTQQSKEITAGGAYLSGHENLAVFALGENQSATLEIKWRNGSLTILEGVQSGRLYEISESTAKPGKSKPFAPVLPVFSEATARLGLIHPEKPYDDYQRQPLLPFKLSQAGPALSWFDLDQDGSEDLIAGAGAGSSPTVSLSQRDGTFKKVTFATNLVSTGDYLGIVGLITPSGSEFIAAVSGYESLQKEPLVRFQMKNGALVRVGAIQLGTNFSSLHAIAVGSAGTNQLAMFVAGGVAPGKYPQAAPSLLLRYESGAWVPDIRLTEALQITNIINAAIWCDLNNDGYSELVLACEWGPIRVFQFANSTAIELTAQLGLTNTIGLWKSVASADFDGDGRLDLIAGNWGENSHWKTSMNEPLVLAYGEIIQPRKMDLIETVWDSGQLAPSRQLGSLGDSLPFIFQNITNHQQYSEASLAKILGDRKTSAKQVSATTLASTVFLNKGTTFVAQPLPIEAQLAPAFGLSCADFNGDGYQDVFLSQNFFQMHPNYSRLDSGRGLLLKGQGKGDFAPASGAESGLLIYGEQRSAAAGDFNQDGRMDLAVAQNGAQTKLYENKQAAPATRIRLRGPAGNPDAIGSQFWFETVLGRTPVQEVQTASGYLSQSSLVKLLPVWSNGTIQVRWPGGQMSSHQVAAGTPYIEVKSPVSP